MRGVHGGRCRCRALVSTIWGVAASWSLCAPPYEYCATYPRIRTRYMTNLASSISLRCCSSCCVSSQMLCRTAHSVSGVLNLLGQMSLLSTLTPSFPSALNRVPQQIHGKLLKLSSKVIPSIHKLITRKDFFKETQKTHSYSLY